MKPVILASASSARANILRQAGVDFTIVPSGVDEGELKTAMLTQGRGPADIALALARAKALKVSAENVGLVIGADQTLELDGGLYDKTDTMAETRDRLMLLKGRSHQLHSAACVARRQEIVWSATRTSTMTMRDFSMGFAETYLNRHGTALMSSVGGYHLEGEGVQLFERIDGDFFAILGLPLVELLAALRAAGGLAS